jgi:hypothetical protein
VKLTALTPTTPTEPTAEITAPARAAVAALVGTENLEGFLTAMQAREPCRARLPVGAAGRLFDWGRLNAALAEHRLAPPRLRLERAGGDVTKGVFKVRRTRRGGTLHDLDAAALNERLQSGATLILDAANEVSPPLQRVCGDLAASFLCASQANLYACWGTTQGFDVHWDDHDVFVVQVEGAKRWALYGATRSWPSRRDRSGGHERPSSPQEEFVLEPGEVLYLPRGWWHAAVGLGVPTLHLTIGLTRKTGADFLDWLATEALGDPLARADLPLEQDDTALGGRIAALLHALADKDPTELAQGYRRWLEARQTRRPRLSFPHIGKPGSYDAAAEIRLSDGARGLRDGDDGVVRLSHRGTTYTVAAPLKAALETLVSGSAVTYAALEAGLPETLRPLAAPFVDEMVGRGVFVVSAGPAG